MKSSRMRSCSGFTLIELTIAVVIVALIGANVSMVMKTSTSAYEVGLMESELDNQTSMTLDRIQLALMSSSLGELNPALRQGLHSSYIDYRTSLGMDESGELVFADPERIKLALEEDQVVWLQNPDEQEERSVVWTRHVAPLSRNELPNGIDDNGNALLDEPGLFFEQTGTSVQVQLTVERTDSAGHTIIRDSARTVTCRN